MLNKLSNALYIFDDYIFSPFLIRLKYDVWIILNVQQHIEVIIFEI